MEIFDNDPRNPAYQDDINYCQCGNKIDSNKIYCSQYCAEE